MLHLIASADPEGGGPIEGVVRSGLYFVELGHEVEIVTLDAANAPFLSSTPLAVHALGPSLGSYGYNPRLVPWLRRHAARYDAVFVNGLWQFHSFATWIALRHERRPYFVYPHGMLDPWFKRQYPLKHAKKWLYWPWADFRVLRDARAVLFTSKVESLLAPKSFWLYKAHPAVVSFGTARPPANSEQLRGNFFQENPSLLNKRILLFLSRIHPKKGCDLLIEAFAPFAAADPTLHLVMAGPDQVNWSASLKARARSLGVAQQVSWPGMLKGDSKWGAFYAADAFVLPSHQENFGIVVAEALGCGVPALISREVNIWREVETAGAGLTDADTLTGTTRLLSKWLAKSVPERNAMRVAATKCFEDNFTVERMAKSLLDIVCANLPAHPEARVAHWREP